MSIAELRRKLRLLQNTLANLEAENESETILEPLRRRITHLAESIRTEGGALVAGDVATGGGDFVGRDKVLATLGDGSVIIGGDWRSRVQPASG